MRSAFRTALLVMAAVAAFTALAAASASAEPVWQLEGKPVTESTPVTFTLKQFVMEDQKQPGGATVVTCAAATGKGTIAPKGAGTITEFKLSKCTKVKSGLCQSEAKKSEEEKEWVKTLHLPWSTQLKEIAVSGQLEDWVEAKGTEDMGWQWECTNLLGSKVKDECTTEPHESGAYKTELSELAGGVLQNFPGYIQLDNFHLHCSLGGDGAGEITAQILWTGPEGKRLSFT
jgi:hypothetical protein